MDTKVRYGGTPWHEGYAEANQWAPLVEDAFAAPPAPEKTTDTQVGGSHYKDMGIQPVDYIKANHLDYFEGNVVKYITRHRSKGGRRDIEKLIHYAQMILENEYNG